MDSTISTDFMILRYWTWISIAINPFVSMIRLDAIKSSWRVIFRYLISFRARRKKKKKEKEWNFSSNEIRPESRTTIREGEKKKKKEEEKQRSGDKVPIYKEDSYWKGVRWPSVCVCVWRISREIPRASINTLKFSGIECTSPSLARSPFHKGILSLLLLLLPTPLSTWVQQPPSTKSLLLFLVPEELLMPGVSL